MTLANPRARAFHRLPALLLCAAGLLSACSGTPRQEDPPAAAPAIGGLVSSAHPLATEAGLDVLRRGGSALDAAIAVQAMLGLVEPQSSGLAGGAVLLHYDAGSGRVDTYLGRERAPSGASASMFTGPDGAPLARAEAMLSGRATGIPGVLPALELAHAAHGVLPWPALFDSTIARAEAGFTVSPRLQQHIDGTFPQAMAPDVRRFFAGADGRPLRSGEELRNPDYADSLRLVAAQGAAALQRGPLADAIAARLAQPPLAAHWQPQDLEGAGAERHDAICRPLRTWQLCVPPPPASGVGLLQLMGLLDGSDIASRGPQDPQAWQRFAEASRLMYADRDHYVGDPDFHPVPVAGLLAPDYLQARRALIGPVARPGAPAHGVPAGAPALAADATAEPGGTSHLVVVDARGNAVSMTTTIESFFGSGRMVGGMFLNNQLTDFSWGPDAAAANAIAPGKRPRSSMSPLIVLDREGRFVGALGSPGGNAIPAYIGKALVGWLYWGLPLQDAIALPNLVARGERYNGERDAFGADLLAQLAALGVTITPGSGEDSGLHGVELREGVLQGSADPRREGVAAQP